MASTVSLAKGRVIAAIDPVAAGKHRRPTAALADPGPTLHAVPFVPGGGPPGGNGRSGLLTDRQRLQLAAISTRIRVLPRMVLYREDTVATCVFINAEGVVKA